MKTAARIAFFLSFAFTGCATQHSPEQSFNKNKKCAFTILHTNDHHGHVTSFDNFPNKNVGGLPARFTVVQSVRQSTKNVLVLDAGDINTGRPESNFFDAEPDIVGYNAIGYDAVTLGNHEFDKPPQVLAKQIRMANFSFLGANITQAKNHKLIEGTKPYIVKDFGDCRVAVLGLIRASTHAEASAESVAHLQFENELEAAQKWIPELRKQADFVIALTHLGIENTSSEGSRNLARNVAGIDLIVDGHTHTKIDEALYEENKSSAKKIPIVQAHQWGLVVGKTEVVLHKDGTQKISFTNIPIDGKVEQNEALKQKLEFYEKKLEPILHRVIGTAPEGLALDKHREQETPIANFVADALLWESQTQKASFAFLNAGSIRAPLPKGIVTLKHVFEMLPYDNSLVMLTLTGAQVRELFRTAAAVQPGKGAFPAIAGVKVRLNRQTKEASSIIIGGKDLVENQNYRVATLSFLATGGDGYEILKKGTQKTDTSIFIKDIVAKYIENMRVLKTPVANRISFENSNLEQHVSFLKYANPELAHLSPQQKAATLCEIYTHDSQVASNGTYFVLGTLDCEGSPRSLMLRSANKGISWTETKPTFVGSQVRFLQFPNALLGYALVMHTREGPGEDLVIKTTDGGKTWRELSHIPKGKNSGLVVVTRFLASSNGIWIELNTQNQSHVSTSWIQTLNEGKTWQPMSSAQGQKKFRDSTHPNSVPQNEIQKLPRKTYYEQPPINQ